MERYALLSGNSSGGDSDTYSSSGASTSSSSGSSGLSLSPKNFHPPGFPNHLFQPWQPLHFTPLPPLEPLFEMDQNSNIEDSKWNTGTNLHNKIMSDMNQQMAQMQTNMRQMQLQMDDQFKNFQMSGAPPVMPPMDGFATLPNMKIGQPTGMTDSLLTVAPQTSGTLPISNPLPAITNQNQTMPKMIMEDPFEKAIVENKDGKKQLKLQLDMKEFSPEEIKVKKDRNKLEVHAHHEEKAPNRVSCRVFHQQYSLPQDVRLTKIDSKVGDDGTLTVESGVKPRHNVKFSNKVHEKEIPKLEDIPDNIPLSDNTYQPPGYDQIEQYRQEPYNDYKSHDQYYEPHDQYNQANDEYQSHGQYQPYPPQRSSSHSSRHQPKQNYHHTYPQKQRMASQAHVHQVAPQSHGHHVTSQSHGQVAPQSHVHHVTSQPHGHHVSASQPQHAHVHHVTVQSYPPPRQHVAHAQQRYTH